MLYEFEGISPQLDDETIWIAPSAEVIGRVRLGSKSSVWFNTVIRGDQDPIVVGAGSNIQEHCLLHTDPGFPVEIGQNCTIGHGAIVHGCKIGDHSLIGMGATVLNGAKIGRNCLIGAGALVTEGKEIPDGMLVVGAPAKPIRELSEAQIEGLLASALGYQDKAKRFKSSLKAL